MSDELQNIIIYQMSSQSLMTSSQQRLNSTRSWSIHQTRSVQKLLLEHMKLQVEEIGITVIYCHGELSTNLSTGTGVTNDEFGRKHPEADTMLLSIYAKLRMNNVSDIVVLGSEDVYDQAA